MTQLPQWDAGDQKTGRPGVLAWLGLIAPLVIIILFVGVIVGPVTSTSQGEKPEVGWQAPWLALRDLNGQSVNLSALKGKVVALTFWATWCPYCRAQLPDLETLYQTYQGQGLVVVAVNVRESTQTVYAYIQGVRYTFPVWLDPQGEAANRYRVQSFPNNFILDRAGVIRFRQVGRMDKKMWEQELKKVL